MNKPLAINSFAGAIAVPGDDYGGGVFANDSFCSSAMVHRGWWPKKSLRRPKITKASNDVALFIGTFDPCWGHCITDNLKFLWVLLDPRYEDIVHKSRLIYVTSTPRKELPKNFFSLLALLGIFESNIERVLEPTKFKEILLPDESFYSDEIGNKRYFTAEYIKTIERIRNAVVPLPVRPFRKIYFTRTGWRKGNPDFGEKGVEDCFRNIGYEIIHPEAVDVKDMIKALTECSSFASTDGSIAHNAVFLPKGVDVVVIRKANYTNPYQMAINEMGGFNVNIVNAHRSHLLFSHSAPFCGPFYLFVSRDLASFAGCDVCFSLREYVKYVFCWVNFKIRYVCHRFPGWLLRRINTIMVFARQGSSGCA